MAYTLDNMNMFTILYEYYTTRYHEDKATDKTILNAIKRTMLPSNKGEKKQKINYGPLYICF